MWQAGRWFPKNTVFVAVVDPGVGSQRAILALKNHQGIFLAPDNGLLQFIIAYEKPEAIHKVTNQRLFHKSVSSTFHGRDIFAPVAARLARNTPFGSVGPLAAPDRIPPLAKARFTKDQIVADIIYQDKFGNLITNLETRELQGKWPDKNIGTSVKGKTVPGIYPNYSVIPEKRAGFVHGRFGIFGNREQSKIRSPIFGGFHGI